MPDPNKLQALRNSNFKIAPTCAICVWWQPPYKAATMDAWGYCERIRYEHGKHTGGLREAGTPAIGHCNHYEPDITRLGICTGSYAEFLAGGPRDSDPIK